MKVVWVHSSKPSSRVVIAYLDSSIVLRIVLDSDGAPDCEPEVGNLDAVRQ